MGLFGRSFVFAEGTGVQEINAQVTNNETLKGVWMSEERAGWMQEISEYVNTGGLAGKDVLLYGQIPALSYYLQMPAAFNPWPDLDSYQIAQLEEDMHKMQERMGYGCDLPSGGTVMRKNMLCIWKRERMFWKHYSPRKKNGVSSWIMPNFC